MHEERWVGATKQSGQLDLSAGGGKQIAPPNHQVYLLTGVVHYYGKMIGPIPHAISEEEIATLLRRVLHLIAQKAIHEPLRPWSDSEPYSSPVSQR